MASRPRRSASKAILVAADFASEGNVEELAAIVAAYPQYLYVPLVLRLLLTYLPETQDPPSCVRLLRQLAGHTAPSNIEEPIASVPHIDHLTEDEARNQVKALRLRKLQDVRGCELEQSNLRSFIIQRAHQVYEETGMLNLVAELVVPFIGEDPELKRWYLNTVLPLQRTLYDFYPEAQNHLSLEALEDSDMARGVRALLAGGGSSDSGIPQSDLVGRDMRAIVGPYLYGATKHKRLKLDRPVGSVPRPSVATQPQDQGSQLLPGWAEVTDWIREVGVRNPKVPLALVNDWSGPADVDLAGYGDPKEALHDKDEAVVMIRRQILQSAIGAVLESGDFETAYSWILTRVVPPTAGMQATENSEDDISWRTALMAGKYPAKEPSLSRLQKRQELLSHALVLAPAKHIAEVLGTWRRCEEELETMTAEEERKAREWDDQAQGDEVEEEFIPGGWASSPPGTRKNTGAKTTTRSEQTALPRTRPQRPNNRTTEVPMSLFDVARSAAQNLSKTAVAAGVPIAGLGLKRGVPVSDVIKTPKTPMSPNSYMPASPGDRKRLIPGRNVKKQVERIEGSSESDGSERTLDEDGDRVRKRDNVLNTVTGGLASGIGWVLGATPTTAGE